MNSDYELSDERWIVRLDERWIGIMNEQWIVHRNERWTWIMNERLNDRMVGRTSDQNFGSIMAGQRLFGQTNERTIEWSDGWTNEPWTIGWTIEQSEERTNYEHLDEQLNERSNNPCALVVLVWEWEWVAMKWLGVAWGKARAPLFIGKVGD